LTSVSGPIYY